MWLQSKSTVAESATIVRAAKKKKIYAVKSTMRFEQLERAQNKRQSASQQFQSSKGSSKKKNVNELMASDLVAIAKALKKSKITSICLFQKYTELQKRTAEKRKLGFLAYRHSEPLFTFSRALAWALCGGGWLQELEIGFPLWERDFKILGEALSQSTTLKRLSFANSELGDQNLQLLGKGLQECAQLEILNLSACALSDAVAPLLSSVLKANVCRKAQEDWQASLRSSKGINALTRRPKGLTTLDISLNSLSDVSTQIICNVLKIGTPLEALNLRGNQLTRISGKLLLDVMEEWETLHFVDLRDNTDNRLMGVLEDRQHLTTFSQRQPLFWTSLPSTRSKKVISRVYRKKSRAENAPKGIKPNTTQKRCSQSAMRKLPMRPQSAPSTLSNLLQKKRHLKRGSMAPYSARKCSNNGDQTDSRFSISEQVKQDMRRPLACPTRNNLNADQMRQSSSCSTSSEIAAWEHDDLNTNENNFPFQMSRVDTLLACSSRAYNGKVSDEEMTHKGTRKNQQQNHSSTATVCIKKEKNHLRPLGLARSCNNFNSGNDTTAKFKPTGIKSAQKKPKLQKSQTENLEIPYGIDKSKIKQNQDFQHNSVFKQGKMGNLPPKVHISRVGTKASQCNSFLKEITQALLHLQERLDKLIGPADPNSLAKQATSQLQVLCEG